MTTREAIVAALSAVPGITGMATRSGPISPGMAWPQWRSTRFVGPNGPRLGAWWVFVALPDAGQDVTVAEADPLVEAVGDALTAVPLRVLTAEPWRIAVTDKADGVPVLRYTVDDE